jgi:hypothetical protein
MGRVTGETYTVRGCDSPFHSGRNRVAKLDFPVGFLVVPTVYYRMTNPELQEGFPAARDRPPEHNPRFGFHPPIVPGGFFYVQKGSAFFRRAFRFDATAFFIEAVGTMPAPVLAAIAATQQILFGENNIAFVGFVKIARLQLFFRHGQSYC